MPFTANVTPGSYQVAANIAPPLASPAVFALANDVVPAPTVGTLGLIALIALLAGLGAVVASRRELAG